MRFFCPGPVELRLPPGHHFPASKYAKLRRALAEDALMREEQLSTAPSADDEVLGRAHAAFYISAISDGSIAPAAMRRIGFPWSKEVAARAHTTTGGGYAEPIEASVAAYVNTYRVAKEIYRF